jgi:hypothetical protein
MKKSAKVQLYFGFGLQDVGILYSQAVIQSTIDVSPAFLVHGSVEKIVVWAHANRDPNKQEVGFIFAWSSAELWNIQDQKCKTIKNLKQLMSFSRPIQWYHSHADPIWPDSTCKTWYLA